MSYNVVKIMCPELGCLKTNFDGVQHLFGQIPLHISSSGTSISINGESHSRIIMFDVKPLADESVALRRLFVLEGNISMDGVRSLPKKVDNKSTPAKCRPSRSYLEVKSNFVSNIELKH